MTTLLLPEPRIEGYDEAVEAIIAERKATGRDRYDEVWNGEYVIMPDPTYTHQDIIAVLTVILMSLTDREAGDRVYPGGNVSDREFGWPKNYRIPDMQVYLADNPAMRLDTHTVGGPDLAFEILSPGDRTYEKLGFYASVGMKELIVVDTETPRLELFRNAGETMERVATAERNDGSFETETVRAKWSVPAEGTLKVEADDQCWNA